MNGFPKFPSASDNSAMNLLSELNVPITEYGILILELLNKQTLLRIGKVSIVCVVVNPTKEISSIFNLFVFPEIFLILIFMFPKILVGRVI